jgi:WD40 repeat protein
MPSEPVSTPDSDPRLRGIISAYLAALAAGETPDRQEWLKRYPDLAAELARFFEQFDQETHTGPPPPVLSDSPGETATWLPPQKAATPAAAPLSTFGDYELLEEIGHGTLGVVYRARQKSRGRLVALKRIRSGLLATPADQRRFHHLAEAVADLNHPNIVSITEVAEEGGEHFVTMRLVEGRNLERRLGARPGKEQQKQAARWIAQLARAVHHAHQRGLLHGNLKPTNVLLDAQGQPHLTDFGLGKRSDNMPSSIGRESRSLGSAAADASGYLAPELTTGPRTPTIAADVYGLGALLYALLTGRPPFRGASTFETLLHVRERKPEAPRSLNPDVDRNLEAICLKCLEKEPSQRYPSAEALADDLDNWLQGRRVTLGARGGRSAGAAGSRGRVLVTSLVTALLVLLLAGGAAAWWYQEDFSRAQEKEELAAKATRVADEERGKREKAEKDREKAEKDREKAEKARDAESNLKTQFETESKQAKEDADRAKDGEKTAVEEKEKAEARAKKSDRDTYFLRVGLARHELFDDRPGRAAKLLDTCAPDLRRWEWRFLKHLSQPELLTLEGDEKGVVCVAYHPSGKVLATAGGTGAIHLWDAFTGKLIKTIPASAGVVLSLAFSRDGNRLVAGTAGDSALVLDLADPNGSPAILPHAGPVTAVAVSPDGKLIAVAAGEVAKAKPSASGEVTIWEWLKVRKKLRTLTTGGRVWSLAFSPDGQRLAAAGEAKNVEIFDPKTGKLVNTLAAPTWPMCGVAFSPDGQLLVAAGGSLIKPAVKVPQLPVPVGAWRMWEAQTGKELYTQRLPGGQGGLSGVAFGPTGQYLALGCSASSITIAAAATGQELFVLRGAGVSSLAYNADGSRLASADLTRKARVWDLTQEPDGRMLEGHVRAVADFTFNPNSKQLVSAGSDGWLNLWVPEMGQEFTLATYPRPFTRAVFHPKGQQFATGALDGAIHFWNPAGGPAPGWLAHKGGIRGLSFSPDGNHLVSSSDDKTLKIWSGLDGKYQRGINLPAAVIDIAFTADGEQLLLGCDDTVRLVEFSTLKPVAAFKPQSGAVASVAVSSAGRVLAALRRSGVIDVWELDSGKAKFRLRRENQRLVGAIAFSPDGKRLAARTSGGALVLWDVASGDEILSLPAQPAAVPRLAFSPNGRWLAATVGDKGLKLWDSEVFDPDKQQQRLEQANKFVRIWQFGEHSKAERAKDWKNAFFYLDRMLEVPSADQWLVRYARGRCYVLQRQWDRSLPELTKAVELNPKNALSWQLLARANAELGHWKDAASDFTKLTAFPGIPVSIWSEYALVRLQLGDLEGYRKTCKVMLAMVNISKNLQDAATMAWTHCLAPGGQADLPEVLQWAQKAAAEKPNDYLRSRALGAALYRAGLYGAAAEQLAATASLRPQPSPTVWFFLALSHEQLHDAKQTQEWFDRATGWMIQARHETPGGPENLSWEQTSWMDRVSLGLLCCEADALTRSRKGPGGK